MDGIAFSTTDLEELQRQLTAWRRRRRGRTRLPEPVWAAASALAASQGVSAVARALRLDYYKLRRRVPDAETPTVVKETHPRFVEVELAPTVDPQRPRFHVEFASPGGACMRIDLGHDVPAVVTLAHAFWKGVP